MASRTVCAKVAFSTACGVLVSSTGQSRNEDRNPCTRAPMPVSRPTSLIVAMVTVVLESVQGVTKYVVVGLGGLARHGDQRGRCQVGK